ncbi:MAG: bifunctional lysylphosphatidylglycerol flippase/synthetase MprF [Phycisphaerales bacterium]|nr:bifunctional lysylphosphatidylglycerol flippase/synthetase MprF [Phycisphaerales bacterium]
MPGVDWMRVAHWVRLLLPFVGVPLAIWLIWHELHALSIHELRAQVGRANRPILLLACCSSVAAVVCMGLYDAVALAGLPVSRRWHIGAVCFAWTNFLTLGPIGGPALRFFLYRQAGVPTESIAVRIARMYVGMWSAMCGVLAAVLVPMPTGGTSTMGRVVLATVFAPTCVVLINLLIRRWKCEWSGSMRQCVGLGLVAVLEWFFAAMAFVLAARSLGIATPASELARTMILGHVAGMASMVPGGLGAADATWLKLGTLLNIAASDAAAHVLVFRGLFYLLPWSISLVVLYVYLVRRSTSAERWLRRVLAGALLANAIILLASAATPAVHERLRAMERWMPVGVFDASHGIAVVAAAWMLFLLRGVLRGYRAAAFIVAGLLLTSAISHTLKGGDWEEATASVALLILLLGAMRSFHRKGRVPIGWELAIAATCGSVAFFLVVGLTAFEKVPYTADLWTRIGPKAEASRMLRGALLTALVGVAFFIRQAVRPVKERITPTPDQINEAVKVISDSEGSSSPLVVGAGDKGVWRGAGDGLIVYQRAADKMIVYADPVVTPGREVDFLRNLLTFTDTEDFDLIFYEVSDRWLGPLHEFGFSFFKLGEEAVIPISGFTMQGGDWSGMRQIVRRVEKAGFAFQVYHPPHATDLIRQARQVSDSWLEHKQVREMQFSLGYFSEPYLQFFPIGGVLDAERQLVAFVNLLATRAEVSVDLMRFRSGLVDNLMDYCIAKSMIWAAETGHTRFSLGMAPLADVGIYRRSRPFERGARLVYQHAERVYNYRGLKAYKEKFHPVWEPRYLAFQGPWTLAESLVTCMRLIRAVDHGSRVRIAQARELHLDQSKPS